MRMFACMKQCVIEYVRVRVFVSLSILRNVLRYESKTLEGSA